MLQNQNQEQDPYRKGATKALQQAGEAHVNEALSKGVSPMDILSKLIQLSPQQGLLNAGGQTADGGFNQPSALFGLIRPTGSEAESMAKANVYSRPDTSYSPDQAAAAYKYAQSIAPEGSQPDQSSTGAISYRPKPATNTDSYLELRKSQQQDRIEQDAIQRMVSVRGDSSIARVEAQRDASIVAYNTIQSIKDEGRMPSQVEYYDILGQLWKARTGASPTDQSIQHIQSLTAKGQIAKAVQYVTGKNMGITTKEILDNIQEFSKTSGMQADKLHEGYMKPHLVKPKGLDDERWAPIAAAGRGLSFNEATKSANPLVFDDSAKEKRYQAWKAKQAPQK